MAKNDDKYTDPQLRAEIKEEVQAGDKGGNSGQWSARKAQMMASKYKGEMHKRGEEPYTTDKSEQSASQKHLSNWTEEDWVTSDGKAEARREEEGEGGKSEKRTKRYLPREAWEELSEGERRETDERKMRGSADGRQFIGNTERAKEARKNVSKAEGGNQTEGNGGGDIAHDEEEDEHEEEITSSSSSEDKFDDDNGAEDDEKSATKKAKTNEGARRVTRSMANGGAEMPRKDQKQVRGNARKAEYDSAKEKNPRRKITQKDSRSNSRSKPAPKEVGEKSSSGSRKENNSVEKIDESHGQPGSLTRLPKQGQHVFWRATPGWVEGNVIEILRSSTSIEGIHAKASEDDPRIALRSAKSGKVAVHKPGAVYF